MSLATLFAAPVFGGGNLGRRIRRLFLLNAALAPIILSTQVYPNTAYAAVPWLVAIAGSAFLLARLLRSGGVSATEVPPTVAAAYLAART